MLHEKPEEDSVIDETIARAIDAPLEARLEADEGRPTLVVRRLLPYDAARLWHLLTDPDLLARWSPIVPSRPLTSPGPATSRENPGDGPVDAEVVSADPPRLLVHHWGDDLLRWTITPAGEGSTLELRQSLADPPVASSLASGWRICLGVLAATADGGDHERVVGQRALDYGWQELRDRYDAELAAG